MHRTILAGTAVAALMLTTACSDDGGAGGGGPGGAATADAGGAGGASGLKDNLPASTGDALADELIKAALACGYQSFFTAPPGWKMTLVGKKGCAVWAPPSWQAAGAGTNMASLESGATGFTAMMGVPAPGLGVSCTPAGATRFLEWALGQAGCKDMTRRYYKEGVEDAAGLKIPRADVILSCTSGGTQKVGYFWVTIQGTSPLCNLLILGFWVPGADMAANVCTATQVLQSIRCPQPGGKMCVDAECAADCKTSGHAGGTCNASDRCVCR